MTSIKQIEAALSAATPGPWEYVARDKSLSAKEPEEESNG